MDASESGMVFRIRPPHSNPDARIARSVSKVWLIQPSRFLTTTKRFFGPIVCVTFGWLALRWVGGVIAFAKSWPWCEFSPPPQQAYVLAVAGGISFGIAPLWFLGSFVYMGWKWFRTREARNPSAVFKA